MGFTPYASSAAYKKAFTRCCKIALLVPFFCSTSSTGGRSPGDSFTVEYNTGGFNDNRNGLELAKQQTEETMRRYAVATPFADNSVSFNEAYGTMVSFVGDKTAQARNSQAAAEALYSQTLQLKESLSGVSLDEEAANLVRFQQSYAASAKIIATSQTVFDTLLQAVR